MSETLEELMKQHINRIEQNGEEELDRDALEERYIKLTKEYNRLQRQVENWQKIVKAWKELGNGFTVDRRKQIVPALCKKFKNDEKINASEIVIFSRLTAIESERKEILEQLSKESQA